MSIVQHYCVASDQVVTLSRSGSTFLEGSTSQMNDQEEFYKLHFSSEVTNFKDA